MQLSTIRLIETNITHSEKTALDQLIFNTYGLKTYYLLGSNFTDTDYRYDCFIEPKLSARSLTEIRTYAKGILAGLRFNS